MSAPPFGTYKEAYIYKIIDLYDKVISFNIERIDEYFNRGDTHCWFNFFETRNSYQRDYIEKLTENRSHFFNILAHQTVIDLRDYKEELEERLESLNLSYDPSVAGLVIELSNDSWENVSEDNFSAYMNRLDKIYDDKFCDVTEWYHKLVDGYYLVNFENAKDEYDTFGEFKKISVAKAYDVAYIDQTVEFLIKGDFGDDFTGLGLATQLVLGFVGVDAPMDVRDLIANIKNKKWGMALLCLIGLIPVIGMLKNLKYLKHADEAAEVAEQLAKHGDELQQLAEHADELSEVLSQTDELQEITEALSRNTRELANGADPKLIDELSQFPEQMDEIRNTLENGDEVVEALHRAEAIADDIPLEDYISEIGEVTKSEKVALSIGERILKYDVIKNVTTASSVSGTPSQILRQGLIDAGIKTPPYPNAAHHIVASGAEGVSESARKSQDILARFGIDVNSPANGVFLPYQKNTWVTTEAMHSGGHSGAYYTEVFERLERTRMMAKKRKLSNSDTKDALCNTLQNIRADLLNRILTIHN